MKPLSGMWLYINLGFAIMWDFLGFILFIINFVPVIQVVSIVGSFVVDIVAIMTDFAFCAIYYMILQAPYVDQLLDCTYGGLYVIV